MPTANTVGSAAIVAVLPVKGWKFPELVRSGVVGVSAESSSSGVVGESGPVAMKVGSPSSPGVVGVTSGSLFSSDSSSSPSSDEDGCVGYVWMRMGCGSSTG